MDTPDHPPVYDVKRYRDGVVIGHAPEWDGYEAAAQWPEGLITLSELPTGLCTFYEGFEDTPPSTVVFLEPV